MDNIVARFEIPYLQIINENSQVVGDLPDFAKDHKQLIHLYKLMYLNRVFDAKAIALQRTGKLGTYPSTRGQEAVFVGMGAALKKEDVFVPYYRDAGVLTQRGVKFSEILLYWGGDERGNCFQANSSDFPFSVPVGSQPLHAAGVAAAIQIKKQQRAVLVVTGDGGTSEGDFYEAMNVAGIWKLPVVFAICNNQWAISVPRSMQTAAETLAQKAVAAGIPGIQVDGNDVIAVRQSTEEALRQARDNHQPALLEMVCYRQSDHTTADDASRYEAKNIREKEWAKEPIIRLRNYLQSLKIWDDKQEEKLQTECAEQVDQAVQEYLQVQPMKPENIFDYLYETLPQIYEEQKQQLKEIGAVIHG